MRYLTLGAIALAAALGVSGVARAADDLSRREADQAATQTFQTSEPASRSLGYAQQERAHPLASVRAPAPDAAMMSADAAFLRLGDRGIGDE